MTYYMWFIQTLIILCTVYEIQPVESYDKCMINVSEVITFSGYPKEKK